MKNISISANSIRTVLSVVLVLVVLVIIGGFYLGLQQIRSYALEVNRTVADANASGNQIDEFEQLKKNLADQQALVDKANLLFSTDDTYQSQALADTKRYADALGLTVSSTNFDTPGADGAAVTGKPFTITIASPTSYRNLLRFLDAIESNVPKMQITSITLGRAAAGSAQQVTVKDIIITIATR